ncbi:S8 family serine peptidase [Streptomyces sp. NPDC048462]|uniref:S8 family peptidase n=1 Tax=Streptomyces sp. NPDC048462 TaxID=3365555 RepID=UPI00371CBFAB
MRSTHTTKARDAVLGTALTALLCALATTPASAAQSTPAGWESIALRVDSAQRLSKGKAITVAVLDTGVQADHPSLKGHVTTGPDFFDDGASEDSDNWGLHGTAMASAVLKVAPEANILSVRVLDESKKKDRTVSGSTSPIAKGIEYAVDHDADVISLSLGDAGNFVQDYNADEAYAIGQSVSRGVTVLASAGNSGDEDNSGSYPAGYPSVISVAATGQDGARASFSTVRSHNAVAAPGVGITMAKKSGGFTTKDGTSPACALTAGVVALMLSHNPKLTPAQVRSALTTTAHHPEGGRDALVGYGLINAPAAVLAAASPAKDRTTPVKYTGKEHFGTPTGTSKVTHPAMEQGIWLSGLGAAGGGLVLVLVAIFVGRRRRTGPRS